MDAIDIVEALAARPAPIDSEWDNCGLCGADFDREDLRKGAGDDPQRHDPGCPWRQAREYRPPDLPIAIAASG